jgi:hypothetical protein
MPAGTYKYKFTAKDYDGAETEKEFELKVLETEEYDASRFFVYKIKDPRGAMKGKPTSDNGKPLKVKIKEITADGIVKIEYN